ncbi:MAG TPA: metal-dependent hydrolase [Gemmatimonadales bacterium]|nr:metal-dependent hydrolase [Gemmatimonadales bacterium]
MSLTLTYLGHSGVLIAGGKHTIALDPFLTGNPLATMKASEIKCTHVAVTHGHGDHLGDTVHIAKANKATVFANWEICEYLGEHGITTEPGNPGGKIPAPFGWVAFTQAYHSSSYEGRYMGNPCGVVIRIGNATVYHCGDTGLFGDMQLLGEIYKPDVAFIPVGDRFTMGPELASRAAELIKPHIAVPIHYATFPQLLPDASGFNPKGVDVLVMKPGQSLTHR